jgi:Mrp family chromosome partitioning ATPase
MRDLLVSASVSGLSALSAGPPPLYGQRLLKSEGLVRSLRQLAQEDDLVIVDAPAVLGKLDIGALAAGSDGTVLVVKAASTREAVAREAHDALRAAGAPVLGVVLTNTSSYDESGPGHQGSEEPGSQSTPDFADDDRHRSNITIIKEPI